MGGIGSLFLSTYLLSCLDVQPLLLQGLCTLCRPGLSGKLELQCSLGGEKQSLPIMSLECRKFPAPTVPLNHRFSSFTVWSH